MELAAGKALNIAVMDTLKPLIASVIDVICFDGNGYTEEWRLEAYIPASIHNEAMLSGAWTSIAQ